MWAAVETDGYPQTAPGTSWLPGLRQGPGAAAGVGRMAGCGRTQGDGRQPTAKAVDGGRAASVGHRCRPGSHGGGRLAGGRSVAGKGIGRRHGEASDTVTDQMAVRQDARRPREEEGLRNAAKRATPSPTGRPWRRHGSTPSDRRPKQPGGHKSRKRTRSQRPGIAHFERNLTCVDNLQPALTNFDNFEQLLACDRFGTYF